MNKKQVIRINESQLKQIVMESVKKVLNEGFGDKFKDYWENTATHQLHQIRKNDRNWKKESKTMKFAELDWLRKETTGYYVGSATFEVVSKNGDRRFVGDTFIGKPGSNFSFEHPQLPHFADAMSNILSQVLEKYEENEPGVIIQKKNE
jgi:hypothetical protein